jgi:hypothetical protein
MRKKNVSGRIPAAVRTARTSELKPVIIKCDHYFSLKTKSGEGDVGAGFTPAGKSVCTVWNNMKYLFLFPYGLRPDHIVENNRKTGLVDNHIKQNESQFYFYRSSVKKVGVFSFANKKRVILNE